MLSKHREQKMQWFKDGIEVTELPPETLGFVYLLEYECNKLYVGKKQAISITKKHFGKKKLAAITDKRTKTYEIVVKENNWRSYEGSSKETEGLVLKKKTILSFHSTKINLTYAELEAMVYRDVLRDERYINKNILGKFFRFKVT